MEALFFDPKHPLIIIAFLDTLKLACYSSKIQDGAGRRVLPHYVNDGLAIALNNYVCAENRLTSLATSVRNEQRRRRKLLRLHVEAENYFVRKYASDQAIAK